MVRVAPHPRITIGVSQMASAVRPGPELDYKGKVCRSSNVVVNIHLLAYDTVL